MPRKGEKLSKEEKARRTETRRQNSITKANALIERSMKEWEEYRAENPITPIPPPTKPFDPEELKREMTEKALQRYERKLERELAEYIMRQKSLDQKQGGTT